MRAALLFTFLFVALGVVIFLLPGEGAGELPARPVEQEFPRLADVKVALETVPLGSVDEFQRRAVPEVGPGSKEKDDPGVSPSIVDAVRPVGAGPPPVGAHTNLHPLNRDTLTRMRDGLLSDDTVLSRRMGPIGVMRSIATILEFEGRGGEWGGGATSMKPSTKDERVISLNGGIYRFKASEFPAFDQITTFNKKNRVKDGDSQITPFPEDMLREAELLLSYAISTAQN